MTQYLEKLEVGQYLTMSGPVAKKIYKGNGNFYIAKEHQVKKNVGMVSGGTGITPFYQIIQQVVKYRDSIKISLVYGNKSEKDILLKDELDSLQKQYPENISITYIIDKAENPQKWKGETGYITKEILDSYLPAPSDDTIIFTCGPKPMNNLVRKFLTDHFVV
mmetsp:Transcript_2163/g.2480  ORF Transcript_2163/g.2480 Transcript_2163/m.2480 type:complete len:163 (+) Transcript_2163:586-1074(+)